MPQATAATLCGRRCLRAAAQAAGRARWVGRVRGTGTFGGASGVVLDDGASRKSDQCRRRHPSHHTPGVNHRVVRPHVRGQDARSSRRPWRGQGSIVKKSTGRLDVIATPIGNLADLSARARQSLTEADLIAAEDTRHTLTLLHSIGVSQAARVAARPQRIAARAAGHARSSSRARSIALVSDAGTPLLSDPGFELVQRRSRAGFEVRAIPGPSAITAALAVAGVPTARFCFEGFLPARSRERRAALRALASEPRTLVFFEAPHRIAASAGGSCGCLRCRAPRGGRARAHQGARDGLSRHARRACARRRARCRISSAARSRSWSRGAAASTIERRSGAAASARSPCSLRNCRPARPRRSPRS